LCKSENFTAEAAVASQEARGIDAVGKQRFYDVDFGLWLKRRDSF